MMNVINIFGIVYHSITMSELIENIDRDMSTNESFHVAFSNPEFMVEAWRNENLAAYLNASRYVLADGVGIIKAAHFLNLGRFPERVTGTDFVPHLCRLCVRRQFKIFFLGGHVGVPEKAKEQLEALFPGLQVIGVHHGFFDNDEAVIEAINEANPDVLMVCLGNPAQEVWISRNKQKINAKLVFGNGGALDFWSGSKKRASTRIQNLGLEWAYRLYSDFTIRRILRQSQLVVFAANVLLEKLRNQILGRSGKAVK